MKEPNGSYLFLLMFTVGNSFYGVNLPNQSTVNKGMILGQIKFRGKIPSVQKKIESTLRDTECGLFIIIPYATCSML